MTPLPSLTTVPETARHSPKGVDPEVLREVLAANRPKLFAIAQTVQQAIARSEK